MIEQIDHVNIVVRNLVESERFYVELLGLERTRDVVLSGAWVESVVGLEGVQARVVYLQPRGGGPRIELIHYESPEGTELPENRIANTGGLRHMAFRVDDIDEMYARLSEAGVRFNGPPQSAQGITHAAGQKRLCYFHGPDGEILELAEYT